MKSNDVVIIKFNNIEIPFSLDGGPDNLMINVTTIAKSYGKRIAEWLRLPSTVSYLREILNMGFSHIKNLDDLVITVRGRYNGGTWMHQLALIEFSRWLDPEFAIWCNMMIISVIKEKYLNEINKRDNEINNLSNILNSQQPKVNYYDQVLQNPEPLYSTRQLVKQLGLKVSNVQLLKKMVDENLIYKERDNQYYVKGPLAKYRYRVSTTIKDPKTGKYLSINRWTEAGKQWIDSLAIVWKMK